MSESYGKMAGLYVLKLDELVLRALAMIFDDLTHLFEYLREYYYNIRSKIFILYI